MSQLFKTEIDNDLLFNYLDLVCEKTEKYYIYDICSYKKGELNGENKNFCRGSMGVPPPCDGGYVAAPRLFLCGFAALF
jgi:hypothetical protein